MTDKLDKLRYVNLALKDYFTNYCHLGHHMAKRVKIVCIVEDIADTACLVCYRKLRHSNFIDYTLTIK